MKSQSSLEYMSTYIWAILVLGICAGGLFLLLQSSRVPVQYCTFPAGYGCSGYYITSNGILSFNFYQTTQYPLSVTGTSCWDSETTANIIPIYNPPSNAIRMPPGSNYTFAIQCYANSTKFGGGIGSSYSGYILINYTNTYLGTGGILYAPVRADVSTFQTLTTT